MRPSSKRIHPSCDGRGDWFHIAVSLVNLTMGARRARGPLVVFDPQGLAALPASTR
jgi:hypothetical protein